jgi:hypothetical protein
MKYNTYPWTYPCYKVIAHSWKISGYNTRKGICEKIEKLESQGIKIVEWQIDKKYFWSE